MNRHTLLNTCYFHFNPFSDNTYFTLYTFVTFTFIHFQMMLTFTFIHCQIILTWHNTLFPPCLWQLPSQKAVLSLLHPKNSEGEATLMCRLHGWNKKRMLDYNPSLNYLKILQIYANRPASGYADHRGCIYMNIFPSIFCVFMPRAATLFSKSEKFVYKSHLMFYLQWKRKFTNKINCWIYCLQIWINLQLVLYILHLSRRCIWF